MPKTMLRREIQLGLSEEVDAVYEESQDGGWPLLYAQVLFVRGPVYLRKRRKGSKVIAKG